MRGWYDSGNRNTRLTACRVMSRSVAAPLVAVDASSTVCRTQIRKMHSAMPSDRARGPDPVLAQMLQDVRQVLHRRLLTATGTDDLVMALDGRCSTPFSRWRSTWARDAARGSCVTITIVFLNSWFSVSQQVEDLLGALRVEVAGRLVGDEHGRVRHDRAGDGDALLLSAGELPRVVVRAVGQADDLERGQRALAPLASSRAWSAAAAAPRSRPP